MKRTLAILLALVLMLFLLPAVAETQTELSGWTVRQLILQKIMLSIRQWSETDPADADARSKIPALTEMNDSVRAFLAEYQPGGVILFAPNTQSTDAAYQLTRELQSAVTEAGAPALLIAIDQEGGRITRLAQGSSMPGNMALGATGNPDNARLAAGAIGEELRALGINMNCAPSLDVNCNPVNPVINVRSFGENPETVAEFGVAYIDGLQQSGVISVVKHFPGHGDTQTDSHSSLPLVDKPLSEIESTELVPFQAAIDAGVQVVMTAHIQFPALDDTTVVSVSTGEEIRLPATLSKKILTGLLRGQMGFDGVIMTDAMNMDAIALHFGVGDAMVRAFDAGVDIALMPVEIMCPGDILTFEAAVAEVEQAVSDGRLSREALEESVQRILKLKKDNGVTGSETGSLEAAHATIAGDAHRALERELADQAVTVIANDGILPIQMQAGDTLLLCAAYSDEITAMRYGVERLISEGKLPELEILEYCYKGDTGMSDILRQLIVRADAVVMDSEISSIGQLAAGSWRSDMPLKIVRALNQRSIPYCDVSLLLTEDAALLSEARALVAVYNPAGMKGAALRDSSYAYGPNLPAAMDVIFGASPAQGRLPVTVYALDEARGVDLDTVLYPAGTGR